GVLGGLVGLVLLGGVWVVGWGLVGGGFGVGGVVFWGFFVGFVLGCLAVFVFLLVFSVFVMGGFFVVVVWGVWVVKT
ncbi:hypothetical protein ACSLWG_23420, partial [Salmonella enterica]|uniref:hypothetical protein n=1 Tax=Salmonella enterica TaxID=28901 RepID=UPI003F1AE1BB